jgi:hypothetical protein
MAESPQQSAWGGGQGSASTPTHRCHVIRRERPQPLPAAPPAMPDRRRRPMGRRRPPIGRFPPPSKPDCSTVRGAPMRDDRCHPDHDHAARGRPARR